MHRMIAALTLFACLTLARPVAQTRESPLTSRDLPRPAKWTKYVPPALTAQEIGGQFCVVMLELLIDPAGKVAEAKVLDAPPATVAASLAAARQWEYEPTIVQGKGVWIRIVSSISIRPMTGVVPAPATRLPPADTVHVSTGDLRVGGGPATLVTRDGTEGLREAFLIRYQAGARQAITFSGPAQVLSRPGNQLAVLPATGRGWVFLPPKAAWTVADATPPPIEVRIVRITSVPVGTARSHQQLESRLLRAH